MYKEIKHAFKAFFKHVSDFETYLMNNVIEENSLNAHLKVLIQAALVFKKTITKNKYISIEHIKHFANEHIAYLYKIHDVLIGKIALHYLDLSQTKALQKPHDTVLRSALKIESFDAFFAHLPTGMFNEFTKGITYFSVDENVGNPIYHRDNSCGDKNKNTQEKFEENISNSALSSLRKKHITRKCYIERMIYDNIYTHVFHFQDLGHLLELRKMERLHDTYYKDESLFIHVTYDDNFVFPEKLRIVIGKKDGKTVIEEYAKKKNNKKVYCTKWENNINYDKIQSFEKEEPWMLSSNNV
jgi:hypothetical protein